MWVLKFSPIFGVFFHNFGCRYARNSFKVFKDADFGLISTAGLPESVEGLNSSLAQPPGEFLDCKSLHETWFLRDLKGYVSAKLNFIWAFSYFSHKTLSGTLSHSIHALIKRLFFLSFYVVCIILH